jgi:hypothetical protein
MLMTAFRRREILVIEHGRNGGFHQLVAPEWVARLSSWATQAPGGAPIQGLGATIP